MKRFARRRRAWGFTLLEMVIVLAVLSILGAVAVTTTAGTVREANVEATVEGVEQLGQWRSQVAAFNRTGTITCWNNADLATTCNGNVPGDPSIPALINEGKPLFWPLVKARWSVVCDQARYPEQFRRVAVIVGTCNPQWDATLPLNAEMRPLVLNEAPMQIQ